MTPTELVDLIRKRHNVVGDNFWSDSEILQHIYDACLQICRDAFGIEYVSTQTTTSGTQAYAYPTRVIALKRVTYNGQKLMPISFREDDQITGFNYTTTATGTPQYYIVWNSQMYLRPIPDSSSGSLQIFAYREPDQITASSTLEVPSVYHVDMADYAIAQMSAKEQNFEKSRYFMDMWEKKLLKMKQWQRKRLRTDGFSNVVDAESAAESFLGTV